MAVSNYEYDKRRLETFIDGIIAIILTILVLELKIPESSDGDHTNTQQMLVGLIPSFISYFGSFLLIFGVWIDHHILFLNLTRVTKRYIILNALFILFLSVVPFTTAFAGHHYNDCFAVALLFVNYFLMNWAFGLLYFYARWKGLLPKEFFSENKGNAIYATVGMIGLVVAIPLAYVHPYLSFALGIVIFAGHLLKKR